MRLKQLIKSIDAHYGYSGLEDFEIGGISCNSKNIKNNFVFVAIKGTHEDGHRFIAEALDRGARAVIVQTSEFIVLSSKDITFIKVNDTRQALARLAAEFYGHPSRKIKVIGITGTNGKTTVTYLIEAILKEAGLNPAVIGTVNYRFRDKIMPSKNTTPGPLELESMLAQMLSAGSDYAVMEVSSHALEQDRIEGINIHSAIFTNLTQDHLDYHHTIENYFQAKSRLFRKINSGSFAVVNNDDVYAGRIKNLTPAHIITYGINGSAEIIARDIKFDITHTEFCLKTTDLETNIQTPLIGMHNVYNVLAAVAWALKEGIDLSVIKSAMEKIHFVPGRLERINFKDFVVFVDYAHTEDALANTIKTLRQFSKNKIIVVFGCGGERDRNKRPKMGKIVSELADFAIITNDNPRGEDPQVIIDEIKKGISKNNYSVIPERFEAIRESLRLAKPGDIVLVAGKGHENYQILNDRVLNFDDREVVRECLKSVNY